MKTNYLKKTTYFKNNLFKTTYFKIAYFMQNNLF